MNNLQQLEKIIREANPGLGRICLACNGSGSIVTQMSEDEWGSQQCQSCFKNKIEFYQGGQLIGYSYPEIHLEHMLVVLQTKEVSLGIDMHILAIYLKDKRNLIAYDLTKQLSEQSEETIKGLLELLK